MMTYVLILIYTGYQVGVGISMHDFSSKDNCEKAKAAIEKSVRLVAVCVEK